VGEKVQKSTFQHELPKPGDFPSGKRRNRPTAVERGCGAREMSSRTAEQKYNGFFIALLQRLDFGGASRNN